MPGIKMSCAIGDKLTELQQDFEDGCLTEKGFMKKKLKLLADLLTSEDSKLIEEYEADLQEESLTEKGYFVKVGKILNRVVEKNKSDVLPPSGKKNGTTEPEPKEEEAEAEVITVKSEADEAGEENGSSEKKPEDVSEEKMDVSSTDCSEDVKDSEKETEESNGKKKKSPKRKTKSENGTAKKGKAGSNGQPSIMSMFQGAAKRTNEVDSGKTDQSPSVKKVKVETEDKEDKGAAAPVVKKEQKPVKALQDRCFTCRQYIDDPDLKIFQGDPEEAVEEFIALTDPKLSLFTGEELEVDDADERPQLKLTAVTVYDKQGHVTPIDSGLIEKNKELMFSGYVKPIYDEDPSIEGGVATKMMGPMNEWWTAGFDGGERALIGFSTAFADYILMAPSEIYKPFLEPVLDKIHMSKVVIEFLTNNPIATYEDLLNQIRITVPPSGAGSYSEDSLLRHSQWIVDQVESYDDAGEDDEQALLVTPCMRDLIKLAGVTLGKRKKLSRGMSAKPAKKAAPSFCKATTTPLVRNIFDSLFQGQILDDQVVQTKRKRCGTCEICQNNDCGKCNNCQDMVKFGGPGRSKQCCINRRCPNMKVQAAEEDDILEDNIEEETKAKKKPAPVKTLHEFTMRKSTVTWVGAPLREDKDKFYYNSVQLDDETVSVGEYIAVKPDDPTTPLCIGRVQYMFEMKTKGSNKKVHVHWFSRGRDTVLGEASDPMELFMVDECEDTKLKYVDHKVSVVHKAASADWHMQGGQEDGAEEKMADDDGKDFFYQFWYDGNLARFEDIPGEARPEADQGLTHCPSCVRLQKEKSLETPMLQEPCEGPLADKREYYSCVQFRDETLRVGDSVYLPPATFPVSIKKKTKNEKSALNIDDIDEDMYPEMYRKTAHVKGSNDDIPSPFQIGKILSVSVNKNISDPSPGDVRLKLTKFYRPEDTHKGKLAVFQSDIFMLYWTSEEASVCLSDVVRKCQVTFVEDLSVSPVEYFNSGRDRFYYSEAYDPETRQFDDPPAEARGVVKKEKGKGKGKGKSRAKQNGTEVESEVKSETSKPKPFKKLRCLDVFAGCGGLSEGFHQAGLAESCWAIEKEEPAAQAYRLNNPNAEVFTDDCNLLLKKVMDGEKTNDFGQVLPMRGEVDLLCGGPPCQGFSGMNRFNSREYSKFKNSLIAGYLSYCDYYRPRFFVLENVRNFVSFKKGMVLKLAMRCLVRMGYQCTFGVLQAGCYGVAQTRRRAIIIAAAPGEKLPFYPEPTHTFSPRAVQLTVQVDDLRFSSCVKNTMSAPHRTITVRDAMSDLPEIRNGAQVEQMSYNEEPQSTFQKLIRGTDLQPVLRDHICKDLSPLVHARMQLIPLAPGSDWRDLPNIEMTLSNGTKTKKLIYGHKDPYHSKSSTGGLRGVCCCVNKEPCDATDRQFNTLIPWCLPHTGNRHNNWAGLYGRLQWDGFFSTTVTNPEPMGKQGRVLHPEQHRVVSVRECARSQGFPDSYRFYGTILDKHRQVGNAVPPPLSRQIGNEMKKCVEYKMERDSLQTSNV